MDRSYTRTICKKSTKIAPVIDTTSVNNTNNALAPVDNRLSNNINQNNTKNDLNYSSNTSLSFSEQLDLWIQGKWNNKSQLVLFKHTPQLYLELGLKDNPITVSSSKLDRIINASGKQNGTYHNLGLETTKQLPNAIANPLNILESSTVNDSIVVVTELSDKDGKIVIVSMAIDGKGHIEVTDINNNNNNNEIKRLNSNVMTSAYGRNNYETWMESNRDRMIYDKDDGIIKKRINGEWLQLPKGINPFVDDNIAQFDKNVKSGTLSNINNMQNNKNNTSNLAPTREYFESKDTNEQPEKLAQILKEKPLMEDNKNGWLKKLATIKFIDKGYYVDKLARKTKNIELSSKYDYSLTANGIANHIIGNGRYDENGNKIGKGLYEIFEPIENSGLLDDFSSYIYHKHNVDRMNLQNRYNEANKAVFRDGMTSEMSEQKVKEYESKYPEFETWTNDIYEYNNANLEMLVKYGVISNEDMNYYNKKYPHYVPTIRQNSKQKTQMDFLLGKKASVNNPIKTAKGGNGDIIPLKDAMALRTMQTVNSSLRNNFGLELLNTVETEQIRNKENIDNIVEDINMEELITGPVTGSRESTHVMRYTLLKIHRVL